METDIRRANLHHAVLPHERRDVQIMHAVTGHTRILPDEVAHDLRVMVSLHQDSEGVRRSQTFDKAPGLCEREGMGKDRAMSHDTQEFVDESTMCRTKIHWKNTIGKAGFVSGGGRESLRSPRKSEGWCQQRTPSRLPFLYAVQPLVALAVQKVKQRFAIGDIDLGRPPHFEAG